MGYWIVPGAPLADGSGWRIWYSREGASAAQPAAPVMRRNGAAVGPLSTSWQPIVRPDLNRTTGVLTVRLPAGAADAGAEYEVAIPETPQAGPLVWRTMPGGLTEEGVAFLFGSCFWRENDKHGAYAAATSILNKQERPAFKLVIGDQLYEDWPAAPFTGKGALQLYADRYLDYWGDPAYQEVLQACPNFFVCDDHEFWNDYPERQNHLSRTWTAASRKEFGQVARDLYEYFQRCLNPGNRLWYDFKIGPVSFFVGDSRSERDYATPEGGRTPHFFQAPQWTDLEAWFRRLRGPGIFIIGQPVYQKDGDWKDHSLSNFAEDYERLGRLIRASYEGQNDEGRPHQVLILSGDIHTGRYADGRVTGVEDALSSIPELIASPASRVGPYPQKPAVEEPPASAPQATGGRTPFIQNISVGSGATGDRMITSDNNMGVVRMAPGTNGRVRFTLSLWRVRPHDNRNLFGVVTGAAQPQGPVIKLFEKEIELQ